MNRMSLVCALVVTVAVGLTFVRVNTSNTAAHAQAMHPGAGGELIRLVEMAVVPIGGVTPYFGSKEDLPASWHVCDGSLLPDTADPNLRRRLARDTQPLNEARLPNLSDHVLAGVGETKGISDSGEAQETTLGQQFTPRHDHDMQHTHAVPPHRHAVDIKAETGNAQIGKTTGVFRIFDGNPRGEALPRVEPAGIHLHRDIRNLNIEEGMLPFSIQFGHMRMRYAHHTHEVQVRGSTGGSDAFDTGEASKERTGATEGLPHTAVYYIMRIQ